MIALTCTCGWNDRVPVERAAEVSEQHIARASEGHKVNGYEEDGGFWITVERPAGVSSDAVPGEGS